MFLHYHLCYLNNAVSYIYSTFISCLFVLHANISDGNNVCPEIDYLIHTLLK